MPTVDLQTITGLADQTVDWRLRSLPIDAQGMTLAELSAQRRDLFDGGFVGPVLTLDRTAVEHNLTAMADWCRRGQVDLAPHGKTTMAPQLVADQIAHGAWGVTVATVAQARAYRAFGIGPIMIANEIADVGGLRWIAEQQDADTSLRIVSWVDSIEGVAAIEAALAGRVPQRALDVLVELGGPGARAGCRTVAQATVVAEAVRRSPVLRLVGVTGYERALVGGLSAAAATTIDEYLTDLYGLAASLAAAGHFADGDEVIVSAGGSVYFDRVAALRPSDELGGLPLRVIIRSGCYLTHDDGIYRASTPSARGVEGAPVFRAALRLWGQVTSRPEPGLALLAMGRRDAPYDEGLPLPLLVRRVGGVPEPFEGRRIDKLNDQHAFLAVGPADEIGVGDWIGSGISHPCTAFDKWKVVTVVDGSTAVGFVRTFF
ncbi:MAG: alanine racemase [Jatrophihabitans sp.]